jgi:hypothetical protein
VQEECEAHHMLCGLSLQAGGGHQKGAGAAPPPGGQPCPCDWPQHPLHWSMCLQVFVLATREFGQGPGVCPWGSIAAHGNTLTENSPASHRATSGRVVPVSLCPAHGSLARMFTLTVHKMVFLLTCTFTPLLNPSSSKDF